MNQIQQEQYTGKGGRYQQLTLPISENILIDEHEPVYVANAQLEELDYGKLYQAYSPRGRKSAAEPRIMFRLYVRHLFHPKAGACVPQEYRFYLASSGGEGAGLFIVCPVPERQSNGCGRGLVLPVCTTPSPLSRF